MIRRHQRWRQQKHDIYWEAQGRALYKMRRFLVFLRKVGIVSALPAMYDRLTYDLVARTVEQKWWKLTRSEESW